MHQAVAKPELKAPAAPHVVGNQPDVLRHILDPGLNLGLWKRPSQTAIARELSSLQPSDLPDVRRATSLDAFDDDVSALLLLQGLNPRAFKNWRADLCRLADIYFSVSENRDVTLAELRHDSHHEVDDEADRASREADQTLELRTRDRCRKLLGKIDAALDRIDAGTYGWCEDTGEPIGLARLDARPVATLCVQAQERRELRERTGRS